MSVSRGAAPIAHPHFKLSIIVDNYNYARYLDESIGAALAVRWPNKEVLVVDDGSTDGSRAVIESYGDQVVALFKENGGLNSAANLAFERCSGDIVIFCDADDTVAPSVAEQIAEHWHDAVSKVQWGQYKVDERGTRIAPAWPIFSPRNTPEWARQTIARTGYYDTPPTSGNAWSRRFLEQVFPLPTRSPGDSGRWGMWFDDYLNTLAPFFGDVISLVEPQGSYRVHGANASAGRQFSAEYVAEICAEEVVRTRAVNAVLEHREIDGRVDLELFHEHMRHRLICRRLLGDRLGGRESVLAVFRKFWVATLRSDERARTKLLMLGWGFLLAFAPLTLARAAARFKQEPSVRPRLFKELVQHLWHGGVPLLLQDNLVAVLSL